MSSLSTEGGEVITIDGSNFGPAYPRTYISSVAYGNGASAKYSLNNCTFVTAHTRLRCTTVPGVGTLLYLQV